MQTVEYNVTGEGRAISITYVDDDGMMQTEFNVRLPWSKEVSLPASGGRAANITIINIGHDVTCSVTVDGVEVNERTRRRPDGLQRVGLTAAQLTSAARLLRGARTISKPSSPTPMTKHRPPMPARTAPNTSTKTENSHGARNDTARPVIV